MHSTHFCNISQNLNAIQAAWATLWKIVIPCRVWSHIIWDVKVTVIFNPMRRGIQYQ